MYVQYQTYEIYSEKSFWLICQLYALHLSLCSL